MSTSAPKRYYHRHFQFTADQTKQSSSSAPSLWHRLSNRFNSRLPLATLCLLGAGILVYLGFFQQPQALTGPIDDNTPIHEQFSFLLEPINPFAGQVAGAQTTDKMVLGFLPYWEVGAAQLQPELTDLAYFGITIGSDGSFVRTQSNGEPDIGTTRADSAPVARLKQQLRLSNTQYHLVFKQFNNDDIQTFLSTPAARDRFIDAVDRELRTGSIQGINMDIEYSGENAGGLQEPYTNLLSELDTLLKTKYPDVILSIDMYASGAENDQIWHVERMAPFVDYIVVMAYDFHRRGSVQSGPVAPIFGDGEKWNGDINSSLADFLAQAPNEKLLLGVPFYGYGWQTTDTTAPSNTFPDTGFTMRYRRIVELFANNEKEDLTRTWQEESLTPYFTYREDGNIYTVQYDDSRSLAYKLSLVHELELGGIAIWALGYEGETRELWDVIERKL